MIDTNTVLYIAHLSRLRLSDKDLALYRDQLQSILTYIETLNTLDTSDTKPTSHVSSGLEDVFRDDVPAGSLPASSVLSNAPDAKGEFFKIPKVIEGK